MWTYVWCFLKWEIYLWLIYVWMRAKYLQSSLTLCNPMDCSLPVSSDYLSKNTGVGCHALLQGVFPTQGLNLCLLRLLHRQVGSLPLGNTTWVLSIYNLHIIKFVISKHIESELLYFQCSTFNIQSILFREYISYSQYSQNYATITTI